jgi:hypothetical protein
MTPQPQPIPEWHDVDAATFHRDIAARYEPAVLRGVVASWPAVRHGADAPAAFFRYLAGFDSGKPVDAILMRPEEEGRIGYDASMDGFNFARNRLPLAALVEQLGRYARFERPPSLAVQSALIPECLPGFQDENRLPLLPGTVAPRIWLGNRVTVPAHFDESNNVACVVAGRRRFTLFPPEQVGNLYIGPLDHAPTGAPTSLVTVAAPDFHRHPRFKEALAAARVAELGPGDAIFIPTLWWHHVESLDPRLNVLVNYWWKGSLGGVERTASGLDSLLHCLLDLGPLPPELRRAWGTIFDHYVFQAGPDTLAHIPPERRGVAGPLTPELARRIRERLAAGSGLHFSPGTGEKMKT